jgi:urease subunit gamma/beta
MRLTPKELERTTIFTVAEMARRRRSRGIKLNHPEAVALICDEILEEARAGKSYDEVQEFGGRVLTSSDVMEGVAELASPIKIEAGFDSGTKLVVINEPIRGPGQ